ncbi:MFS monocarboxylate transporter [Pyrenophora seminiperda CCB06]|uniref:MFS monocarboxylate transporter n=1 Tax=Pyrenophora seminiperda CCB06 TaxID=1302712 RepID=A0A3M7MAQ3_9PLEO|nr:MFS monocarboxylate transporter [Pyrenophora seminiperda CCB06]
MASTAESSGLELADRGEDAQNHSISLPPVDGGKDAWLFLAASFVVEALVWGFPFSYGVFQEYYSTHEPFAGDSNVAVIGTCAMICLTMHDLYMAIRSPALGNYVWPHLQRWATAGGLIVMCLALGLSSLSNKTTELIASQGVIYALGGSLTYSPCILYMDEWFNKRKGLAYGIMWAGTGLAGVILPLVMEWMLNKYGFRTTLRVWAVCLFVFTAPLLYFVRPRIPLAPKQRARKIDFTFLGTSTFGIHQACNIIEALVSSFLPSTSPHLLAA